MYRRVVRQDPSQLREARDGVLTEVALQVLSVLTGREFESYDDVLHLLGVPVPLLARGFQIFHSRQDFRRELAISHADPVLIGWAYQVWNEAYRSQQTWGVSKHAEQQHEHVDLVVVTQLFTDEYISDFLVTQAIRSVDSKSLSDSHSGSISLCDPACGTGHILARAVRLFLTGSSQRAGDSLRVHGFDIDPDAIELCRLVVFLEYLRAGRVEKLPELWGELERSIVALQGPFGTLDRSQIPSDQAFDVVIANPPYLGRRKLSSVMRAYLDCNYPAAKVDLCAAFMQRCIELTAPGGAIGFVTTDKWLRLAGYEGLRKGNATFRGLLGELSFQVLCELGSRAFHPQMELHDGVRVALLCGTRGAPSDNHTFRYFSASDGISYDSKVRALSEFNVALGGQCAAPSLLQRDLVEYDIASRLLQVRDTPPALAMSPRRVRDVADVIVGLQTNDDARYVRWVWEIPPDGLRWRVHAKGGGYTRWCGNNRWVLDWERGSQVYLRSQAALRGAEEWTSKAGWTYNWFANGSLGLRVKDAGWSIGRAAASGVFCSDGRIIGYLNSRYASMCVRSLGGKIQLPEGVVRNIPIPPDVNAIDPELVELATCLKRIVVSHDPADALFNPSSAASAIELLRVEALILLIEGCIESQVAEAIGLGDAERRALDERLGLLAAQMVPICRESWEVFWRLVPESYRALAPRIYGALGKTFELVSREALIGRDRIRLAPKRGQAGWVLPATGRLEALCRQNAVNPVEVVVAYGEQYADDIEMQRDLSMPVLYTRALTAILHALEHEWWSEQSASRRVGGREYTLAELCAVVNASEGCAQLSSRLGEPLTEGFLKSLMAWQEKVFARRSPIRYFNKGEGVVRHLWDESPSLLREPQEFMAAGS